MKTLIMVLLSVIVSAAQTKSQPKIQPQPHSGCITQYVLPHYAFEPPPHWIPASNGEYKRIDTPETWNAHIVGNGQCHFDKAPPPLPQGAPPHSKVEVNNPNLATVHVTFPPPPQARAVPTKKK